MAATGIGSVLANRIAGNWCLFSSLPRNNYSVFWCSIPRHPATTSSKRIRASAEDEDPFISQEDLKYLVKLGGGSVAGAAAIKYGSIIFPEITQPNLVQALLMIFVPLLLALFLLIKQSRLQ